MGGCIHRRSCDIIIDTPCSKKKLEKLTEDVWAAALGKASSCEQKGSFQEEMCKRYRADVSEEDPVITDSRSKRAFHGLDPLLSLTAYS